MLTLWPQTNAIANDCANSYIYLYNIDENDLRKENSIPEGVEELREGSAIFIPGADEVLESKPEEEPQPADNNKEKEPEQIAEQESIPDQSEKPEAITSEESETESGNGIDLIWPADGKIIKKFSSSSPKSDGIDIEFEKSTEIHAAADGKIIYSAANANFGNMVIIRHNDEFITIYAYLHTIFAKEGQMVSQNDPIGLADTTETKQVPMIHFEVRKAAKPVDPMKYLPENK